MTQSFPAIETIASFSQVTPLLMFVAMFIIVVAYACGLLKFGACKAWEGIYRPHD